jgi:UDP-2,4-diacetamido-2,4,6-trideoxy-beta-L-altropyranose hydrolase
MNVFFRVDASSQIGSGHVIRCLTLAKALKKQGIISKFICRSYKNNLIKKIKKENFEVAIIPNSIKVKSHQSNKKNLDLNYPNRIGSNWREDAEQTIHILSKVKIDWLIVDHYGIDIRWEKKIRPYTKKIMVIDDLANRNHDCDLLLDQNLINNLKYRYKSLLPKYCSTLLGPQYALLQEEYKDLHLGVSKRIGNTKRILVYFGDTNQNNLIEMILDAFFKLERKDINLDIVINSKSLIKKKIKQLSKKNNNIKIYSDLTSLSSLMIKADLAIGACGTTTWERCCLGLPSIVITIANHQKPIAKELNKLGSIYWLGHYDMINNKLIYDILKNFIDQNLESYSVASKRITNGCGAEKVASILTLNCKTKLKLRYANLNDEELILNWANDFLVRANAFNSRIITKKKHKKWFHSRINNPKNYTIFILETKEKVPIGQVRLEKKNKKFYVSYSLDTFARGKNIAYKLLKISIRKFKKNRKINFVAKVKKDNISSCKVFKKIGFKQSFKNNICIFSH